MKPFFRWLTFFFILSAGIAGLAIYWTFYESLPKYDATFEQPSLQEKVDIHWDSYGVPHIYAQDKYDLYYALGYVNAQDRLWQMTLKQMAARGNFSKFLGKKFLQYDELQRTLGFWDIAQKIQQDLSDTTRNNLQAYSDGINAYVKQHSKSLPIQFSLNGAQPIRWTVTYSIAIQRMMAWSHNTAWKTDLTYARLVTRLPQKKFNALLPDSAQKLHIDSSFTPSSWFETVEPMLRKSNRLADLLKINRSPLTSDSWIADSKKSSSGRPLLASDKQNILTLPGPWYEVHLNLRGHNLSGAMIPGMPVILEGQNDNLAWSSTNVMVDNVDFYKELVDPKHEGKYARERPTVPDSLTNHLNYKNIQKEQEIINIKGADDTVFTHYLTKHGPVVSNLFSDAKPSQSQIISMQWAGQDISHEMEAFFDINWSTSLPAFQRAIKNARIPGRSFLYADKKGTIAQFLAAAVPRRAGNPLLLRKGQNPSQDWQGYIRNQQLSSNINPDRGWLINPGNVRSNHASNYYISAERPLSSSFKRIKQYLTQDQPLTPAIAQQMQLDDYSLYAKQLTSLIIPVLQHSKGNDFKTIITYLQNWDFAYDPSETAASIMDVFMLKLAKNTFQDDVGETAYAHMIKYTNIAPRKLLVFLKNGSSFFDDKNTSQTEHRRQMIIRSMEQTIRFLKNNFGPKPFEWRWERLHKLRLEAAQPSLFNNIIKNLFDRGPYPAPGNGTTINSGPYHWDNPYRMQAGSSLRRVVDLSDLSRSRTVTVGGQSENPFSSYYADQTEIWLTGKYKFLYQSRSLLNQQNLKIMKLPPSK